MAALFSQKLLKTAIEKFSFPDGEKQEKINGIIQGWQTAFKDHDLSKAKETSLQGKFFAKFFCEILGYTTIDDISGGGRAGPLNRSQKPKWMVKKRMEA